LHHKLHVTLEEAHAGGTRQLRLGTMNGEKVINVKIPKGVSRGQELRLKGQGEPGTGKDNAGDLYLEIDFTKHPLFDVDGNDVTLVLPVSPWEAALGASVEVPTLGGRVNLKIPPNSQNGNKLRLKGRGLGQGDQIVVLKIVNPRVENERERSAFEAMKNGFQFDPREKMGW
jgi:curved DNA-binding protein